MGRFHIAVEATARDVAKILERRRAVPSLCEEINAKMSRLVALSMREQRETRESVDAVAPKVFIHDIVADVVDTVCESKVPYLEMANAQRAAASQRQELFDLHRRLFNYELQTNIEDGERERSAKAHELFMSTMFKEVLALRSTIRDLEEKNAALKEEIRHSHTQRSRSGSPVPIALMSPRSVSLKPRQRSPVDIEAVEADARASSPPAASSVMGNTKAIFDYEEFIKGLNRDASEWPVKYKALQDQFNTFVEETNKNARGMASNYQTSMRRKDQQIAARDRSIKQLKDVINTFYPRVMNALRTVQSDFSAHVEAVRKDALAQREVMMEWFRKLQRHLAGIDLRFEVFSNFVVHAFSHLARQVRHVARRTGAPMPWSAPLWHFFLLQGTSDPLEEGKVFWQANSRTASIVDSCRQLTDVFEGALNDMDIDDGVSSTAGDDEHSQSATPSAAAPSTAAAVSSRRHEGESSLSAKAHQRPRGRTPVTPQARSGTSPRKTAPPGPERTPKPSRPLSRAKETAATPTSLRGRPGPDATPSQPPKSPVPRDSPAARRSSPSRGLQIVTDDPASSQARAYQGGWDSAPAGDDAGPGSAPVSPRVPTFASSVAITMDDTGFVLSAVPSAATGSGPQPAAPGSPKPRPRQGGGGHASPKAADQPSQPEPVTRPPTQASAGGKSESDSAQPTPTPAAPPRPASKARTPTAPKQPPKAETSARPRALSPPPKNSVGVQTPVCHSRVTAVQTDAVVDRASLEPAAILDAPPPTTTCIVASAETQTEAVVISGSAPIEAAVPASVPPATVDAQQTASLRTAANETQSEDPEHSAAQKAERAAPKAGVAVLKGSLATATAPPAKREKARVPSKGTMRMLESLETATAQLSRKELKLREKMLVHYDRAARSVTFGVWGRITLRARRNAFFNSLSTAAKNAYMTLVFMDQELVRLTDVIAHSRSRVTHIEEQVLSLDSGAVEAADAAKRAKTKAEAASMALSPGSRGRKDGGLSTPRNQHRPRGDGESPTPGTAALSPHDARDGDAASDDDDVDARLAALVHSSSPMQASMLGGGASLKPSDWGLFNDSTAADAIGMRIQSHVPPQKVYVPTPGAVISTNVSDKSRELLVRRGLARGATV